MSSEQEKNIKNLVHAGATYMQGNLPVLSEVLTVLSYIERHCKKKSYKHTGAYLYVWQDRTQVVLLPDEVSDEP